MPTPANCWITVTHVSRYPTLEVAADHGTFQQLNPVYLVVMTPLNTPHSPSIPMMMFTSLTSTTVTADSDTPRMQQDHGRRARSVTIIDCAYGPPSGVLTNLTVQHRVKARCSERGSGLISRERRARIGFVSKKERPRLPGVFRGSESM